MALGLLLAARRSATAGLVAAFVVGCELLVPDTVGQFNCNSTDPSACPPGMTCNLATQQCGYPGDVIVVPDGSDMDVTADDEGSVPPPDVGSDVPTTCRGLGCKCSGAVDCDSRICADSLTVTPTLYQEVNHGFCVQPCCTSNDCPGGFVCFATSAGGNYCIDPSLVGRSTPGSAIGGTSCTSDSQCRSGLCSGTCQDPCCSMFQSGECASGSVCRFGQFPGRGVDVHYASHCTAPGGSTTTGNYCTSSSSCKSGLCYYAFCTATCRDTAECGSGNYCNYQIDSSNDIFAGCFPGAGSVALGGTCTSDSQCATALCDQTSKRCTDVCYADSACGSVSGWWCRPEYYKLGAAYVSMLLCGS
jgi:hypothetical protein